MTTITDIATKAGVSRATVSYVLNRDNTTVRISDVTRSKVLDAAAELGYRRNELARAVITGKNRMLGFWVMQSNREPVVRVLAGAMQEADRNEHFIKMIGFDNEMPDARVIDRCIEWRLAGIIAIHAPEATLSRLKPQLDEGKIPLVVVDSQRVPDGSTHIRVDDAAGVRSVIEHLASLGHRNITMLSGEATPEDSISQRREQIYRETMKRLGFEKHCRVAHGWWETNRTEAAARALLDTAERPTAIACLSDHKAMIAIRVATQMGLAVPRDLSITGFDDLGVAAITNPALTTVSQPFEEMGRLAVRRLLGSISPDLPAKELQEEEILPSRLIVRESSAPLFNA